MDLADMVQNRKLVVFGTGSAGIRLQEIMHDRISWFVDNDPGKIGRSMNNSPIEHPHSLLDHTNARPYVLVASAYYEEIAEQLMEMGFAERHDFCNAIDFFGLVNPSALRPLELLKRYINQNPYVMHKYSLEDLYESIGESRINPFPHNGTRVHVRHDDEPVRQVMDLSFVDPHRIGFDYLIHGSIADGTATKFSDIDDIVILRPDFFESYETFQYSIKVLHMLNVNYQQFDITQHHGHWLFTGEDFRDFDDAIMPIAVFEDAVSVFGEVDLQLSRRKTSSYSKILNNQLVQIDKLKSRLAGNCITLYELKHMVSGIALIFPLYFQTRGQFMTKKMALQQTRNVFDQPILDVLDWATNLRANWHHVPSYDKVEKFKHRYQSLTNRHIVEKLVALHSPAIPHRYLVDDLHRFLWKLDQLINAMGSEMEHIETLDNSSHKYE